MKQDDKRVNWDVIVAGGGPAGCGAAIAAARHGAQVLIVEAGTSLGGMGTAGLVPTFAPFSNGKRVEYGGIAREVAEKLYGCDIREEDRSWRPIHAEKLKLVYESLVLDAGASIRFCSVVCGVERDGDRISRIQVAGKDGVHHLSASVFIDTTGDGDVAAYAGCDFEYGRTEPVEEEDSRVEEFYSRQSAFKEGNNSERSTYKDREARDVQPATFCFILAGVREKALTKVTGDTIGLKLQEDEALAEIRTPHCCMMRLGQGVYGFNAGHIWNVDPNDQDNYTRSLITGRKMADQYQQGLAKHFPDAFSESFLIGGANLLGIRETRRIIGEKTLTLDDYLERREFTDGIGRNCYPIDIHQSENEARIGGLRSVMDRYENYRPGESHGIPYGCLVPKKVANLLVAGRCVSAERSVQGSIRIQACCLVMGQAAGTAAALARRSKLVEVRRIDIDTLRKTLIEDGAVI